MKKKVALWTDCLPDSVDINQARGFLCGFGFDAQIKGELFDRNTGKTGLRAAASFLAGIRIKDFESPAEFPFFPSPPEIEEEFSKICSHIADPSVAYDGLWFQRKLHGQFAGLFDSGVAANIVYTGRTVCTYEENRYHARVVIMEAAAAAPQIVSAGGAVEGPAKPPEYYWAKGRIFQEGAAHGDMSGALSVLNEVFEGRFIGRSDPLLGRAVAAYGLQPLIYVLTGKQFCENRGCSLFNSHRQSEVLAAQAQWLVCEHCRKNLEDAAVSLPSS